MPRQRILIDPVTRIEGHSKISLHLDEEGHVEEAYFHVTQFRGFEKFCEGRPFYEMPSLMARICGICPVSHLIASAKACDAILAVRIPPNAVRLRKVLNLAQILQSHALSFFYLSVPDLLLGMDSDPAARNIFGVMEANPAMARDGIRLRQFQNAGTNGIGCASQAHLAHAGASATPCHAQTVAKLARHEIGAEVRREQQVQRLGFRAIIAQLRRLQPLVEHARTNVAAQAGTDGRPGVLQARILLRVETAQTSNHCRNILHKQSTPINCAPVGRSDTTQKPVPGKPRFPGSHASTNLLMTAGIRFEWRPEIQNRQGCFA